MQTFSSVSDLSLSSAMRRYGANLKADLARSNQELASGQKAMPKIAGEGDFGRVFHIDRKIEAALRYRDAISVGKTRLETTQASIGNIRENTHRVALNALAFANGDTQHTMQIISGEGRAALDTVVSTLNQNTLGTSLFSGTAVDGPAIADADQIMADVMAIVGASADAVTALAGIDAYFFNAGGGFETSIYLGATTDLPGMNISDTQTVDVAVRADETGIRTALRDLAVIASISGGAFAGQVDEQTQMMRDAAESGVSNNENLVTIQERLGYAQEQFAREDIRNKAEEYQLMSHRNEIANVDGFEVATRIRNKETQLEAIYLMMGRMQGLTLTNFIR